MKCESCRETFTLYYYPSSDDVASSTFPPWRESPFIKIDTVAANSRFDAEEMRKDGINQKTLVMGPLKRCVNMRCVPEVLEHALLVNA